MMHRIQLSMGLSAGMAEMERELAAEDVRALQAAEEDRALRAQAVSRALMARRVHTALIAAETARPPTMAEVAARLLGRPATAEGAEATDAWAAGRGVSPQGQPPTVEDDDAMDCTEADSEDGEPHYKRVRLAGQPSAFEEGLVTNVTGRSLFAAPEVHDAQRASCLLYT